MFYKKKFPLLKYVQYKFQSEKKNNRLMQKYKFIKITFQICWITISF